ncbi:hypothetical protein KDA11_04180 [Candidatus Saccharibacteria bacterium]|nr:hypothetical protein [Candidatus Saccharibacteria bacterium]
MSAEDMLSENTSKQLQNDLEKDHSADLGKPEQQRSVFSRIRSRAQLSDISWIRLLAGEPKESDNTDSERKSYGKSSKFLRDLRGLLVPRPEIIADTDNMEGDDELKYSLISEENIQDNTGEVSAPGVNIGKGSDSSLALLSEGAHSTIPIDNPAELNLNQSTKAIQTQVEGSTGVIYDISNGVNAKDTQAMLQRNERDDGLISIDHERSSEGNPSNILPVDKDRNMYDYKESLRSPLGALLAVDLINYSISRRRDAKIRADSMRRDRNISKELHKQSLLDARDNLNHSTHYSSVDKRLNMLEKQHKSLIQDEVAKGYELAVEVLDKAKVDKDTTNKANNNNIRNSFIEKISQASVGVDNIALERSIDPPHDEVRAEAQKILHSVELAAENNIPVEAQYELRHEHKGNDSSGFNDDFNSLTKSTNLANNGLGSRVHDNSIDSSRGIGLYDSNQGKQPLGQQIAVTGGFGALVGVMLFIVFYILAR